MEGTDQGSWPVAVFNNADFILRLANHTVGIVNEPFKGGTIQVSGSDSNKIKMIFIIKLRTD